MKKVIEVMPEKQSKGTAIQKVLGVYGSRAENKKNCLKYFIVCIGDDVTDEDLFEANKSGVNIRVQKESKKLNTCAEYYLTDPDEVILFLEQLLT